MKKTTFVQSGHDGEATNPYRTHWRQQPMVMPREGDKKDLLLRHPSFVAKSTDASLEPSPLACEGSNPWPKMERTPCWERQMNLQEMMKTNTELGLQVYLTYNLSSTSFISGTSFISSSKLTSSPVILNAFVALGETTVMAIGSLLAKKERPFLLCQWLIETLTIGIRVIPATDIGFSASIFFFSICLE